MVIFKTDADISASFREISEFLPKDNFILVSAWSEKRKFIKMLILFKKTPCIQNQAPLKQ